VTAFIACRRCGVMYFEPIKPGMWGRAPVVPHAPRPRASELPGDRCPSKEHPYGNEQEGARET
jgi:hypothetical protein